MTEPLEEAAEAGWGWPDSVIMGAVIVAVLVTWALYITSPPNGFVSTFGMVVSLASGAYLPFGAYVYLKKPVK